MTNAFDIMSLFCAILLISPIKAAPCHFLSHDNGPKHGYHLQPIASIAIVK
jgi:hypothetical protein